jgi:transcriptional regulator with GAF, ATPase, and Fis domain
MGSSDDLPGTVRELRNALERAATRSEGWLIVSQHLACLTSVM